LEAGIQSEWRNIMKKRITFEESVILETYDNLIKIAEMKKAWLKMAQTFWPFWFVKEGKK